MASQILTPEEIWRGIILLGKNTATYKLGLAKVIIDQVMFGKSHISMDELSKKFFEIYKERLKTNRPQLNHFSRKTVMERVVSQYNLGLLTQEQAINEVKLNAFNDVLPRFHTIDNVSVPSNFYQFDFSSGVTITDSAFEAISTSNHLNLIDEITTRWDLLEAAFEIRRSNSKLENDIREFYLLNGYKRTEITHLRSALDGYQKGICFYCGLPMAEENIDVDHVIPRQIVFHDEVWNLVLTHSMCNQQKSDHLPTKKHIQNLIHRNEFLIKSNHPLKDKIINALGSTPKKRYDAVMKVYNDAIQILRIPWDELSGYDPATDPIFQAFVKLGNE